MSEVPPGPGEGRTEIHRVYQLCGTKQGVNTNQTKDLVPALYISAQAPMTRILQEFSLRQSNSQSPAKEQLRLSSAVRSVSGSYFDRFVHIYRLERIQAGTVPSTILDQHVTCHM